MHLTPLSSLGVGNSSSNLDFVLRVPVSESHVVNHEGRRHAVRNGEFNDFKRKDCRFVTTWIKSEGLQRLFFCTLDRFADFALELILGKKGIFNDLKWLYGGAFEQLFCPESREFEHKFFKNSNARCVARVGNVKASI